MMAANANTTDSAWSWLVAVCAFVNIFLVNSSLFVFGILLIELRNIFDASTSVVALIGSIQFSIMMCASKSKILTFLFHR